MESTDLLESRKGLVKAIWAQVDCWCLGACFVQLSHLGWGKESIASAIVKQRTSCMFCGMAGRLVEILGIKELFTPYPRTAQGGGNHTQYRLIWNDSSQVVLGVMPNNILWQISWSVTWQSQGCPGTGFHGCSGSRETAAPETASSDHLSCYQRP